MIEDGCATQKSVPVQSGPVQEPAPVPAPPDPPLPDPDPFATVVVLVVDDPSEFVVVVVVVLVPLPLSVVVLSVTDDDVPPLPSLLSVCVVVVFCDVVAGTQVDTPLTVPTPCPLAAQDF